MKGRGKKWDELRVERRIQQPWQVRQGQKGEAPWGKRGLGGHEVELC